MFGVFLSVVVLAVLDRSLVASCKDSIGWMFSKLDTNSDLYLDQAELAAINLDKYEVCIRPFFNSCDSYKDGKVSTAEWCLCFWRESEYPGGGCESFAGCTHKYSFNPPVLTYSSCHMHSTFRGSQLRSGVASSLCAGPAVFLLILLLPHDLKQSPHGASLPLVDSLVLLQLSEIGTVSKQAKHKLGLTHKLNLLYEEEMHGHNFFLI